MKESFGVRIHPTPQSCFDFDLALSLLFDIIIKHFRFFFLKKNHILLELEKFLCNHFPPGFTDAAQGLLGGRDRTGACVPSEFCASDQAPKPASWSSLWLGRITVHWEQARPAAGRGRALSIPRPSSVPRSPGSILAPPTLPPFLLNFTQSHRRLGQP